MVRVNEEVLSVDDFNTAMLFWESGSRDIVLQVPFKYHIPQLKRFVIRRLGEPGFNHGWSLKYNGRAIKMKSVYDNEDFVHDDWDISFYVDYELTSEALLESRLRGFCKEPYSKSAAVAMVLAGIDVDAIMPVLENDGWSDHDIEDILWQCKFMR